MDVAKPKDNASWNSFYWIGLPLALFLLLASILVWQALKNNESNHLNRELNSAANLVINPLENTVKNYVQSLIRMGKRWDADKDQTKALWYEDAKNYHTDTQVFEAIGRVDIRARVLGAVPSNKELEDLKLSNLPKIEQPLLSGLMNLTHGGKGFLIIVPLHDENGSNGAIIASVNIASLMHQIFQNGLTEDYGVSIYQDKTLIYTTSNVGIHPPLSQERVVNLFNTAWKLRIWPTEHLLYKLHTWLPHVVLAAGTIASILVLMIFYFHNQSRLSLIKSIQAKLESEHIAARLHKIIATVHEGFISFDQNGKLIDWNPYAEKMLGWSKEEALGKNIYDLVIPERNTKSHQEVIRQFMETKDVDLFNKEIEFSARRRDGNEFPVEVVVLPLEQHGQYTFHAFVRDITLRKKLEIDQARLISIIDSSDDAILSTDLNAKIVTWNRGAEHLYGYNADEILGQSVSIIYPDEIKPNLNEILEKIKSGHHIQNHNTIRIDKYGRIIPVSVAISPIRGKKGKIIGISSITRDMTERMKIEKMKNEFISIVSHELRTPLTSIRGSLGLLGSEKIGHLTDKAKHLVEIANTNCERLVRLINDILDIEKIEAGKMEFQFKPLDINHLIQECIEANYQFAAKYHVNIKFYSDEHYWVQGDYDRLTQVMTNLLSNAIRYSPQNGSVRITIAEINDKVRISVTDDGPGIPEDFQNKVFGKFTQADSSSSRKKSGTGLGLNISKAIIEKHSGTISFNSAPGKGATFYFDLPISRDSKNVAKVGSEHENHEKMSVAVRDHNTLVHEKTDHAMPNILSVEDDTDVIQLISLLLQDRAKVWSANTIEQAKQSLSQQEFDLIILDLNLPDGISTDLLPCLNYRTKEMIPVIVFSIDELDNKYVPYVKHVLLKSKVTNEQLYYAIKSAINKKVRL